MPETPAFFTGRFGTANHWRVAPLSWIRRTTTIASLMSAANCHAWGTQETEEAGEAGVLAKIAPAGTFRVFSDRSNITIMGRGDQLERLWRAEYSVPADNRNRHHQAVKFRHRESGVEFLMINTHFSNGSEWAAVRTRHARVIVGLIRQLGEQGIITDATPVILVGDFNDRRRANQPGPAQEFKTAGLVDARDVVTMRSEIDLVYGRNVIFRAAQRIDTPAWVSDHDWWRVTVDVGLGAPKPPPPLLSPLDALIAKLGPITALKVASFNEARVGAYPSRYAAVVQDWLGREVTTIWSAADQEALDQWRHAEFPSWPPADYTGAAGPTSMNRLRAQAAAAGKTVYPVVP
jgi:hypothetical protein